MIKNYLKVALRTLRKYKGYSFINVAGLALGLACCVLMLLFVQDERSYDRFHENADRIYRITMDAQPPNAPMDRFAITSRPIGTALRAEYPEIEHVVRLNTWNPVIRHEGTYFYDDQTIFAEPAFFDVFSFPLIDGDPATALAEPNALILTETTAQKYFGTDRAVGQTLTLDDSLTFNVTGVMADIPSNSHFTTDIVVSYATLENMQPENPAGWLALGGYTYVLLKDGVSASAFEQKMSDLVTRHFGETLAEINFTVSLGLQPLTSIHLYSDRQAEWGPNGDIAYVYIFSAIALFVLLIACINFMNLATARSMERAKEVGVRKVVGSSRAALIRQFLSESVLLCVLALIVAVVFIAVALPFFNNLAAKEIAFSTLLSPGYVLGLIGITLFVGLLAGSYPAFLLSSFPSIDVLKGTFKSSSRGVALRKGLVVFQFAISIAMIAATTIVFDQLDYMRSQDLGFDKEQVVVIDGQGLPGSVVAQQFDTAKDEFERLPGVQQVATSTVVPGRGNWLQIFSAEGLAENDSRRAQIIVIDDDYLDTYQIEMAAGRGFSDAFETDRDLGILLNETAVENIGWGTPEDALGKTIDLDTTRTVIGVVKDYHHTSLKQALEPMLFVQFPQFYRYFSVRVASDDLPTTMASLEETWNTLFPAYAFESFFLDEDFDNQYRTEQQLTKIFGTFAFLAVLIACLGLFGLAAFTAQQRTKEIGVRKVLGASVPSIVLLLSKEFTYLVLAAVVLAAPVAYFAMDRWLEAFPYRVPISIWIFVGGGLAALLIAWLTVSYQAIRAALADPVNSLRYE